MARFFFIQIAFIEQYIPKDAKLHLVGHSIGCWMILQLLKNEDFAKRVVKCYLLFPTIERMAETPNGRFLTRIVSLLFIEGERGLRHKKKVYFCVFFSE